MLFIYVKNIAFNVSVAAAALHAANMLVLVVAVTAGELKMETFPATNSQTEPSALCKTQIGKFRLFREHYDICPLTPNPETNVCT